VIVVDDASTDETAAIATKHEGLVRLVRNETSQGAGAARNRGAEAARASVLAFTDDDCFAAPQWLAAGLDKLREADLVQGRVEPDPTARRTPFDRTLVVQQDSGFYQTANLFVRREIFDAVGGFRDWVLHDTAGDWSQNRRRGRAFGEDTLFGWSARRLGARSAFAPEALTYHAVIPGTVFDDMADRWNWARNMPAMARLVPELRETTFHRRVFFSQWSAWFDYALAGLLASAITRDAAWMMSGRPYARYLREASRQWSGREAAFHLLGAPLVDAVTLAGFLIGSARTRSLVL
jgi:glycosyltransferase involved in cell wall biosynthesis